MTDLQLVEFSKLELSILDAGVKGDMQEMMRLIGLMFFWVKREVNWAKMQVAFSFGKRASEVKLMDISEEDKCYFALLQADMIGAAGVNSQEKMIEVELLMRNWFDRLIYVARNSEFSPEMKIVRN